MTSFSPMGIGTAPQQQQQQPGQQQPFGQQQSPQGIGQQPGQGMQQPLQQLQQLGQQQPFQSLLQQFPQQQQQQQQQLQAQRQTFEGIASAARLPILPSPDIEPYMVVIVNGQQVFLERPNQFVIDSVQRAFSSGQAVRVVYDERMMVRAIAVEVPRTLS